jgi:hypothetical protein
MKNGLVPNPWRINSPSIIPGQRSEIFFSALAGESK